MTSLRSESKGLDPDLMAGDVRKYLVLALKVAVSAATLWLVLRSLSYETVVRLLSGVAPAWLVVALFSFLFAQLFSALRFLFISRALGCPVTFRQSLGVHFIGLWFNQVLPTSLGGDVVKIALLRQLMNLSLAFRVTILDRAAGFIFLLVSIVLLLPFYSSVLPSAASVWGLGTSAAGALAVIAALSAMGRHLIRMTARIPLLTPVMAVFADMWRFRRGRPLLEQAWTSAIVHVNGIVSFALIGQALHVDAALFDYFLIVPLVFLIALLPISFAGWGIREIGAVWLFGLINIDAEHAASMSVLYGLMLVVAGTPGLAVLWSGSLVGADRYREPAKTAE